MILDYITWNANPEIVNLKVIAIRYYGLFFAISFYLGYVIFTKFFKKERIPQELLDKLTIYMALGTLIGARLGHCLLYEPSYYLSNPAEILKVWKGGLASHGAGIGIIAAIILFCRKTKKNFFWVMDRIVIVAALAGFFIRMGNLMNSEIYGIPTNSKYGFIYARSYTGLFDESKSIKNFRFKKMPTDTMVQERFVPIKVEVKLDNRIRNEDQARNFIET
ncbi:MAG: prolipoprotein diacylglyceryl transferase, partial [Bacteroidales bacterium]|nr:prolipoprotein diacylglyceryl transferase [Bacteroidales bacterium]